MPAAFKILLYFIIPFLLFQCTSKSKTLPILGKSVEVDGEKQHHKIPDFSFIDQDSNVVNNQTFAQKAYVADFFFTSCPTICPKMAQQMLRIHDHFSDQK